MNKNVLLLITVLPLVLFLVSCKTASVETVHQELRDGKYDSEFPYRNGSDQLNEISKTIKMIHCMAFYERYSFNENDRITKNNKNFTEFTKHANLLTHYHETSSGTATTIYSHDGYLVLLTCAHIITYPDTVISYFADSNGNPTGLIQSISIKTKQINYLPELTHKVTVDTIATDKILDLAILGGKYKLTESLQFPVFNFPLGNTDDLSWGSFVYLFGYPLNNKILTKGIVSNPSHSKSKYFWVDASINRGFSGGIVIAIRDGIPNFELVGIIKSSPAKTDYFLSPAAKDNTIAYDSMTPYAGKIYVKKDKKIRYGLTRIIPVEHVISFLNNNSKKLLKQNIIGDFFFKK